MNLTKSREGGKHVNYSKFEIPTKQCKSQIFPQQKMSFLWRGVTWYFHDLDLIFTCLFDLQSMQMIFFMSFLIFPLTDPELAENRTNLAGTPKLVGLWRVHRPCFSQLLGTLDTWWNQGNTKCQGEWWSGLSRESQGLRPC